MSVDEIVKAYTKLSAEERAKIRAQIEEMDADEWDRQIEADAKNGKLDKLVGKSENDFREGRYRKL